MHPESTAFFLKAFVGFLLAGTNALATHIAVAENVVLSPLLEYGSLGLLLVCLLYAITNLWKANQSLQKEVRAAMQAQIDILRNKVSAVEEQQSHND